MVISRLFAIAFVAFFSCVNCDCMQFLREKIINVNKNHHRQTCLVFESSFLQQDIDEARFFDDCIEEIRSFSEGANLLKRLNALFLICANASERPLKLEVSFNNGPSCFGGKIETRGDYDCVRINLNIINDTLFHADVGLCTVIQCISGKVGSLCSICDAADPYWMLIAHEMMHMEHFLTEEIVKFYSKQLHDEFGDTKSNDIGESFVSKMKSAVLEKLGEKEQIFLITDCLLIDPIMAMYKCLHEYNIKNLKLMCEELFEKRRYSRNKDITPQNVKEGQVLLCPEVSSRTTSHLWNNLEERETVIGAKNSELALRFEALLPIRYIYQLKGKRFYEDFDTIYKIVKASDCVFSGKQLAYYINNNHHASYFDARKFRHIVDEELLSHDLFTKFGLSQKETVKISSPIKKSAALKKKTSGLSVATKRKIIDAFNNDNLAAVVSEIYNADTSKIKLEVTKAISDTNSDKVQKILEKTKAHITSVQTYDRNIIEDFVSLLKSSSTGPKRRMETNPSLTKSPENVNVTPTKNSQETISPSPKKPRSTKKKENKENIEQENKPSPMTSPENVNVTPTKNSQETISPSPKKPRSTKKRKRLGK